MLHAGPGIPQNAVSQLGQRAVGSTARAPGRSVKRDIKEKIMAKRKATALVLSQTTLPGGMHSMWLKQPEIAADAVPGQFISVYPNDHTKLLPRPFGICETDPENGRLRIVYQVTGPETGTAQFSACGEGDSLEILGPLGNGFPLKDGHAILIGGGIGTAPLLELAKKLKGKRTAVLGYRSDGLYLKEDFEPWAEVFVATEDGSAGTKGNVLDAIREQGIAGDVIYACGPTPMLKAVKKYALESGIECYLSLDERMACGVGACLACVCHTKDIDDHSHVRNTRICKDGPVFRAEEVELLSADEQRARIAGGEMTIKEGQA